MIAFLDTSALIKLYIAEPGSQTLQNEVEDEVVAVSQLTYGETFATFARRLREDLLSPEEHQELCADFEDDWQSFVKVPFGNDVLVHVPGLCRQHPLRGADAMQLACAAMLRKEQLEVRFVTSDQRLLEAARGEGLTVFDPENP